MEKVVVSGKVSHDDRDALGLMAEKRGTTVSVLVGRAISAYIKRYQPTGKKASK